MFYVIEEDREEGFALRGEVSWNQLSELRVGGVGEAFGNVGAADGAKGAGFGERRVGGV